VNIAIDATPLLVRSAGVKNYLYHWIRHLQLQAGRDTIRTFPPLGSLTILNHEGSAAGPLRTYASLAALALTNYTPIPALDWLTRGADVYHATVLTQRPPRRVRLTATVHDMTAWTMPELHPEGNRRAERNFADLARRADRLIAVSQCTKDDAVRVLGLAPEKITVIHSGIADAFFDPPRDAVDSVRRKYGLKRPFVLFVGTVEPRKNLDTLIDAYLSLPTSLREEYELVIAGPMGWADAETRSRLASSRYLGYVPEPDLAPLTAAATVFAYPSLYEGFGFPVAQAMAAGVPIVTSNVSSLPEIAGGASLLADPRSPGELRDALSRLLLSPDLRSRMSANGIERARQYRWPACAAQSLEFFRSL
jgi:glycosyltransferase involved in cell wall biosynthesis